MKLSIKNMVCPRCITAVEGLLNDLQLQPQSVELGEAIIFTEPDETQLAELRQKLQDQGFELLEDGKSQVVDRIKSIVINHIHHSDDGNILFSELLASELHKDYSGLSKLFSAQEGITIEQYIILQKTEKVKELLQYNQLTLSEIADVLGYSSVAHLSAQFRKTTGVTPSAFRKNSIVSRQPLDAVTKKV
nr:helix-turn-helix domain-containing protein [uncultured Flavobacterium sp.]